MEYHLYHDESKVEGYWHGMLLVPVTGKDRLVHLLRTARDNTQHEEPIGIKHVRKDKGRVFTCSHAWLLIAAALMRSRTAGRPFHLHLGARTEGRLNLTNLDAHIGAKFILFRSVDNHAGMELLNEHAARIETTFRVGLKGGMHYLGSETSPIILRDMHFDGHEHYGRNIDRDRIIGRIAGLRDYCSVELPEDRIHDHTSDHRDLNAQEYDDCQLLQLTDLMIGSFRTLLGHATRGCHNHLASPMSFPLDAFLRGYAGYENSRWFSSFWMSQCRVGERGWEFSTLEKNENDEAVQGLLGL